MNKNDLKKAAKKIQNANTFQELHDIMVAYVNLDDYKSQNIPAEIANTRRCPSPRPEDRDLIRSMLQSPWPEEFKNLKEKKCESF